MTSKHKTFISSCEHNTVVVHSTHRTTSVSQPKSWICDKFCQNHLYTETGAVYYHFFILEDFCYIIFYFDSIIIRLHKILSLLVKAKQIRLVLWAINPCALQTDNSTQFATFWVQATNIDMINQKMIEMDNYWNKSKALVVE